MKLCKINIFDPLILTQASAICFTSNGVVKANGELTMGAGIAKTFRDRYPGLAGMAGQAVKEHGNICQQVYLPLPNHPAIVAFPTKHHWKDSSDIDLIFRSAVQLSILADNYGWTFVALPKPGCANGGLNWADVESVISGLLDNRFAIVYV